MMREGVVKMPIWINAGGEKEECPMDTRIASIVVRKVTRVKHKCHEFGCDRDCYGEYCAEHGGQQRMYRSGGIFYVEDE